MQIVTPINIAIVIATGTGGVISNLHTHGARMFIIVRHVQVAKTARDVLVHNAVRVLHYVNHPDHLLVMQVNA